MRTPARRRRLRTATALLLPAALLLAACAGTEPEPAGSPTPRATASATPSATPSPTPTPDAGTGDPEAAEDVPWDNPTEGTAADGSWLTATDLRTGSHEGFDRVVLELSGTGSPGFLAHRSAVAVEDPTGDTLDLEGEGYLGVVVTGLASPPEGGLAAGTAVPGISVVTGAEFSGVFEGESQLWLGLTDPEAPYRVFTLTNPTRLVIDVQRSMA